MDSTLMDIMGVEMGGQSLINALSEIDAGNFASKQFEFNEQLSSIQAEEAGIQGKFEQNLNQEKTAQLSGQQVAAEAAQGSDVKTGTAAITRQQTGQIGGEDYLTIGTNAMMKELGYKIQGINEGTKAWQAQYAGQNEAMNSLLSGAEETMKMGFKAQAYDIETKKLAEAQTDPNSLIGDTNEGT